MKLRRSLIPFVLVACGGEAPVAQPPVVVAAPDASTPDSAPAKAAGPDWGYPATRKQTVTETLFGTPVTDDYRWLEDLKSDEVKAWGTAQDSFARDKLKALPERDVIAARLKQLFYVESMGAPWHEGSRWFFSKREATQEKSIFYVRDGKTGAPRALIDPNAWSTDGSVSLRGTFESHDGKWVAYLKNEHNSDEAVLHVLDAKTGKDLPRDVIKGAKYANVQWTPKSDGFYYTWVPPVDGTTVTTADRPGFAEVRFHKLGEDSKTDVRVHDKTGDPKTFIGADLSRDGRWLVTFVQHGWASTDLAFRDTRKGEKQPWTTLVAGKPFKYEVVSAYKDRLYIKTDDGAPNGHVMVVDPAHPEREKWTEVVPERKDMTLGGAALVGGMLSLSYLKDVATRLELHDLTGKLVREIPLPALGTASNLIGREDDDEAYFTFTSFTYPTEIYETSVKTGKTSLYFKTSTPVDPSKYLLEQSFATSKDGTKVPYFVVHAKDQRPDGTAPTLVYGYGGFLSSQTPGFTSSAFPWLEHGGVYVVANLRGGAEYGEAWHQAGMRGNKQNVFDDLYAVAEKLIADKVTSSDKLVVRGASNGGLLVATAITQRPELFRVGLCGVPLVDMLRYHLFGSGKTWIEEYGTAENEADFKTLAAYSPYQHVKPGVRYPSLLVLSADSDDRVDPMHAWKFAAEVQARSTGGVVLLRVEKNSGHGGADLIKASVEKVADELAFALSEVAKPRP